MYMVMYMWIRGYKLKSNEVPPYYIQVHIKELVRELAEEHNAEFKASVHSEACYLKFDDVVVAFRNHPGKPKDVDIYLSDFKSWKSCEKYFKKYILTKMETLDK